MKITGLILTGCFFLSVQVAFAHIGDTIIAIKEVKTTGVRFDSYSVGARIYRIDTSYTNLCQSANLGELLSQYSLVSVKSYGPSGLSSISMRGGSSRHTAVIWNGFNLKSPMSGSLNFSTVPAGFIDQVTIQSGGSSTMYGSGASTGVIFLTNKLYPGNKELNINTNFELSSFHTYSGSIILTGTTPRLASRLKFGYIESENDFKYKSHTFGRPVVKLEHASYKRYAVSQQNTWITGQKSKLESDIWYTTLQKLVPSLMSDEESGTAEQQDKNLKSAVTFSYYLQRFSLKIRSGFFIDHVYYKDTVPQFIESTNKSYSTINEIESKLYITSNHTFNAGLNLTSDIASSSGYVADTGQIRYSVYGRYVVFLVDKRMNLSFEARQELMKYMNIPLVFSFGGQYEFLKSIYLKANISKHYSLPLFDDLFWAEDAFAVGNPDLKPEYGWNYEAGIKHLLVKNEISIENELTVFQNRIKDLIIWMPLLSEKWTPTNYNNSITSGLEFSGSLHKMLKHEKQIDLNYCLGYTDSKIYSNDEDENGIQRLYVPKYKMNLGVRVLIDKWQFTYNQIFESKRFFDDVGALDGYTLADIHTGYKITFKNAQLFLYGKIKNVFGVDYQIIKGYAQPFRNYTLGFNLSF